MPRLPENPNELLIVRPDGYVGLSAGRGRWLEAERYVLRFATASF